MDDRKLCPIFCLKKEIDIDNFSKMIDWAYKNKNEETVLILTENDVRYYQNKWLWEIISNETGNCLFGLYEDDWIFDLDVMKNIVKSIIEKYLFFDDNINKILFILNYAIINQKSVIFYL